MSSIKAAFASKSFNSVRTTATVVGTVSACIAGIAETTGIRSRGQSSPFVAFVAIERTLAFSLKLPWVVRDL